MNWERHFREMNRKPRIQRKPVEYSKEYSIGFGADFGAMERGQAIPNTNGAVIPPGRYWLDSFDDANGTRTQFMAWLAQKPEVKVESTQEFTDSSPTRLFTIFTIPTTANNYGKSGVWFPTTALGFPEIAPATGTAAVTSSDDTVVKPDAPTATDIAKQIAGSIGQVAGSGTKGLLDNVDTATMIKLALAVGAVIFIATLPSALMKRAVVAAV